MDQAYRHRYESWDADDEDDDDEDDDDDDADSSLILELDMGQMEDGFVRCRDYHPTEKLK